MNNIKLENYQIAHILSVSINILDNIKDIESISVEKFRELSNNDSSFIEYTLNLVDSDTKIRYEKAEEEWNYAIILDIPLTVFLDELIHQGLDAHNDNRNGIFNNGFLYLTFALAEILCNAWDLDDIFKEL